jgi:hypothetical protein
MSPDHNHRHKGKKYSQETTLCAKFSRKPEPAPTARPQGEIAAAERIRAANPAVAYGSAVNEVGGKRRRR